MTILEAGLDFSTALQDSLDSFAHCKHHSFTSPQGEMNELASKTIHSNIHCSHSTPDYAVFPSFAPALPAFVQDNQKWQQGPSLHFSVFFFLIFFFSGLSALLLHIFFFFFRSGHITMCTLKASFGCLQQEFEVANSCKTGKGTCGNQMY